MGCTKIAATTKECCELGTDICHIRESGLVAKQSQSVGDEAGVVKGFKDVVSGKNGASPAKAPAK